MKLQATQARKHHGGTLTGFVVGLLVGLGLALSVAVYVTRVPVPFVDRGVSRKPAQDAAEAERNKGWNPNAGLAGKPAPLPEPPVAPEQTTAPTPPTADPAKPAAKPADAVTAKPAADPLGDLMKSKTGDAADPAGADPFAYFVQAGAFRSPEEAQAQKARLAMLGMDATVSEREQAGRTVFRVRMGPFNQKSMADATREQLEVNGVEAALVRVQR
ncbi:SPOR domain-containing protein [Hydrogenophaga sp. A37]|uniref:SPOR domain-containing protein n=1 Tax=Hydrogenophaga sp. A37 TaxID=1945864 RepID=UPI000986EE46|nr:SPOR domain-containing protein [Hydrogenophaga sp. A37]OOG86411.1 sporulation protein [Hydrogenophaga sp. A37]